MNLALQLGDIPISLLIFTEAAGTTSLVYLDTGIRSHGSHPLNSEL